MGKTIIFTNQKGGVAKTTTTYNVATQLANLGYKTLMMDLDPQASLTIISGITRPEDYEGKNITELMNPDKRVENIEPYVIKIDFCDNLYLIPSDISLAQCEPLLYYSLRGEDTLKKVISKINEKFDFDFVCIDCPPSFGSISINTIVASDIIIGCVEPAYQALRGLQYLKKSIENIESKCDINTNFGGVVVGKIGRGNNVEECLSFCRNSYDVLGEIKLKVETSNAEIEGLSISMAKPNSVNAVEFKNITEKILNKVK